ncbi:MAG: hypothetical protein CUN56_09335 [Phototrophicales bacterium]|nr:MAG: hypothetical protein CUN56_09335 [Phototrophicales bacterium]RMG72898.1 MAG: hypothetical protein D6711_12010 [Chloroflexota bacterium]
MIGLFWLILVLFSGSDEDIPPTLEDFWEGRAEWVMDIEDVGLPVGESDTVNMGDGVFWSYLHASYESAYVVDQCGEPVAFPGCLTRWESTDGGETFTLPAAVCLIPCDGCPCQDVRDHHGWDVYGNRAAAQQYPRVFFAHDEVYLVYEWHAQTILRRSNDGINWSDWVYLRTPGGTWHSDFSPCTDIERIGSHPNIRGEIHNCLVGAPPGIYVEGDMIYVFVAAGSAPGHMRCYKGNRHQPLNQLQLCDHDPLFSGAVEYGPVDLLGAAANPYFDFRYVSSAEVVRVGDYYYMAYEGIRGPEELEIGMDTQFGLGFARARVIDGEWEKFPGNPVIMDMGFNWGIGHADIVIVDGITYLYTATSQQTRGRYVLRWVGASG